MVEIQKWQMSLGSLHFRRRCMLRQPAFSWFEDAPAKTAWQARVVWCHDLLRPHHRWRGVSWIRKILQATRNPVPCLHHIQTPAGLQIHTSPMIAWYIHNLHHWCPHCFFLILEENTKANWCRMLEWFWRSFFPWLFIDISLTWYLKSFLLLAPKQLKRLSLLLFHLF